MLKIYFDWNCITHSKDDYPYILNIAEECRNRFIFPFSNAHIRDLLVSHNNSNVFFDSDLNLLERICGNNYLLFENGQMLPKLGTPRDVIDISGDTLEAIQKFELISPETYHSIKEEVRKHLPSIIFKKIQGANPKDVISTIDNYISKDLPNHNLESLLSMDQPHVGQLIDAESRFKTMCMALDIFGFRPEKRDKQLMNIDADSSHIFYAGHCDIFVTADSKLCGKAEAMYKKYNYQTRIIHPKEFESFIDDELQKEYSFSYMSNIIDEFGTPRMEEDGAHYKLLPNHILGTFNVCHKLDKFWGYEGNAKAGLFRYCFNNTPYLFYSEIQHFFDFIRSLLSPSEKDIFEEGYVKPMLSRNYEITSTAKYILNYESLDMTIEILSDPESPVPAAMILFAHGDKFKELYNQLISKSKDSSSQD